MRRRRAPERKVVPDPKFRDIQVARMINVVMERGKKSLARSIVYGAFDLVAQKTGKEALEVFKQALDNVRPLVVTKSRRVGGATYQVPIELDSHRGHSLAMRWIRSFARTKKGQPMEKKLASEILDAYNKTGASYKRREDTHRMAEANKAFSHYRW